MQLWYCGHPPLQCDVLCETFYSEEAGQEIYSFYRNRLIKGVTITREYISSYIAICMDLITIAMHASSY